VKFYLYADETIWTSPAGFLIVAVVTLRGDEVEDVGPLVTRLEVSSGRDKRNWAQSLTAKKIAFLDGLGPILEGCPPVLWRHDAISGMADLPQDPDFRPAGQRPPGRADGHYAAELMEPDFYGLGESNAETASFLASERTS